MSSSDEAAPLPIQPQDHEAWRALLQYLEEEVPGSQRIDSLDAYTDRLVHKYPQRDRSTRSRALEEVADKLGLTINWRTGRLKTVARQLHEDEVAVCWTTDGWVAVRRPLLRRIIDKGPWGHVPQEVAAWACFASAWPASALAAGKGASPWQRLGRLLMAERRDISLIILYGVAAALLSLATPVAVQVLVNTIAFGAFQQPLFVLSMLLAVSLSLSGFLRVLQAVVVEMLQRRLLARVTDDLCLRLPKVRLNALDHASGREYVNRFFDVFAAQKYLATLLLDGIAAFVAIAVGLTLLAFYHPFLLGFDAALIAATLFILFGLGVGGPPTALAESSQKYKLASWLEDIIDRPDLFKHDGGGALAARRAGTETREWMVRRAKHFRIVIRQVAAAHVLQVVALTGLLGIGGWLVLDGQLSLGQLVAAEIVIAGALASLVSFAAKLETLYDLLAATSKLGFLLDLPLDPEARVKRSPSDHPLRLEAEGVALPLRATRVDFSVPSGQAVEIGIAEPLARQHLADMLVATRTPASGLLRLDDVDMSDAPTADIVDRVVLIRTLAPLDDTVRDNLTLAREDIDDDMLRDALSAVGLMTMVESLPEGLDTLLKRDDHRLSHEDRVRLATARALAGRPRLIVIDGVFDDLTADARSDLIEALSDRSQDHTVVILTRHRDDAKPRPVGQGPAHQAA